MRNSWFWCHTQVLAKATNVPGNVLQERACEAEAIALDATLDKIAVGLHFNWLFPVRASAEKMLGCGISDLLW